MTQVMGILNVTPDSFSDGGEFLSIEAAVAHARAMERNGANVIDVGGESTRPGARVVDEREECERVLPVIKQLCSELNVPVSIDTQKALVALRACEVGASIINDISAGSDPEMIDVARHTGADLILMHMQGTPENMQDKPVYDDVVEEVKDFLLEKASSAAECGISADKIWIDPGVGFGKTVEHNFALLRCLKTFVDTPYKVCLGASRKSFLRTAGEQAGYESVPSQEQRVRTLRRIGGSLAAALWASHCNVAMVRVHDVQATVHALTVANCIQGEKC
ncbi:dihydropteroate synthase [Bdellovibrionota bacterium]